jgi:GTPase SAR1 family protein
MNKVAHFVFGPAGVGKSHFISTFYKSCEKKERNIFCVNMDPGAETFSYPVVIDIRSLISIDLVMETEEIGPNCAIVETLELFQEDYNLKEWLQRELGNYDDDYLFIDCVGQVELYTHLNTFKPIVEIFIELGYKVSGIFLLDITYILEPEKFVSGILMCISTMCQFEQIPWTNVMTKIDLLKKHGKEWKITEDDLEAFLDWDIGYIMGKIMKNKNNEKFEKLIISIMNLLEDQDIGVFYPFDKTDENSIERLLYQIDNNVHYLDDLEPVDKNDNE